MREKGGGLCSQVSSVSRTVAHASSSAPSHSISGAAMAAFPLPCRSACHVMNMSERSLVSFKKQQTRRRSWKYKSIPAWCYYAAASHPRRQSIDSNSPLSMKLRQALVGVSSRLFFDLLLERSLRGERAEEERVSGETGERAGRAGRGEMHTPHGISTKPQHLESFPLTAAQATIPQSHPPTVVQS